VTIPHTVVIGFEGPHDVAPGGQARAEGEPLVQWADPGGAAGLDEVLMRVGERRHYREIAGIDYRGVGADQVI
jgi:hypothetical protein